MMEIGDIDQGASQVDATLHAKNEQHRVIFGHITDADGTPPPPPPPV